jgi:hypothetical protein
MCLKEVAKRCDIKYGLAWRGILICVVQKCGLKMCLKNGKKGCSFNIWLKDVA